MIHGQNRDHTHLPFGGVRTSTGIPTGARFPGQWFQTESGLHQNWMRDYDPVTGRYIEADPLGLVDGASVYGYVRIHKSRTAANARRLSHATCKEPARSTSERC